MDLTKLKTVRAAHRGSVADLLRNYEEVQGNPSNVDFCHLSTILELSYEKRKLLQTFNEQIVELSDIGDIEDEVTQTTEYNVTLNTKIKQLEGFLKIQRDQQPPPTQRTRRDNLPPELLHFDERDHNTNHSESRSNFNHVQNKLPKLTLPTFSGDILQWQSFWDSFESTVHLNSTLSDVEKFRYLKTLLRDDAAQSIAGFTLTNANYRQAVNLLTERFGQPHKITEAYIQAMLDLPSPRNNVNSLRVYYDRLESYIRGLEALGQHQDTFGIILIPIIFGKLPDEIKQNLARQHGNISWTLSELRKAILHEVSILEIVRKPSTFECTGTEILPTTATFFTGTKSHLKPPKKVNNDFKPKVCTFCEESHSSNDCTRVPDYESRMSIVRRQKLCFNCLKPHQVSECRSKYSCRNCHRKHHTSLCRTNSNPSAITTKEFSTSEPGTSVNVVNSDAESSVPILHSATFTGQQSTGVLLKTAVAPVWLEQIQATANILFDEGAQRSFITESLARKLQLVPTRTDTISLSTFGDTNKNVRHLKLATIHLETGNGEKLPLEVLIVPEIAVPLSNRLRQQIRDLAYLKGLRLAHPVTEEDTFEISLLIGVDYYWEIVQDKVIRGDGPTAVESKIGYLLSGPLSKESKNLSSTVLNILTSHKMEEFNLERFWELEGLGISTRESDENTKNILETYQDNSIILRDGQYQAKLPWKDDHPPLPTNYNVTLRRTQNTIKRLSQETSLLKKYGEIISDQERRDFIEKVDTTVSPNHPVHYIPHHAVKKDSTTTPIRIVYDCSCRQSSAHPSLNDCLQTFPPNINCLTTILMRFRLNKFALATDIEKAFLHVGLDEQDRDVTRFLWLENPDDPNSPLCTYRFKAVLFGATCSPFILNATLLKHMDENDAQVTQLLKRDLYVDNILSSVPTESDALDYFRESRQLMSKASFNLRSWTSNSVALRDLATSEGVLDTDAQTKILGMRWNVQTDHLSYPSRNLSDVQKSIITKREILQQTSRVYDPLGFLSPVSVRAKILMQLLWEQKFGWDEPLPTEIRSSWIDLAADLDNAAGLEIPRHYFFDKTEHDGNISLHVFCDASPKAYGAAVYISDGIQTRLVIAKNRVAPLKKITLPQLELMAAVVGSRLANHVISVIDTTDITLWSDSQITLHWLLSSKQHKKCFIANRVKEIHELTQSHTWRYCPTDSNPADLLTRGITATDFKDSTLWFNGPKWLSDSTQWPIWHPEEVTTLSTIEVTDPNESEVKSSPEISTRNSTGIHKLIDVKNFSSYTRLLHVTANVQRFISNCKSAKTKRKSGPLTTTDLQLAGKTWILDCQKKSYQAEIASMRSDCPNRLQLVRQLRLFIDKDGTIRCGGRIHNAPVREEAKFPYLLPTHHELTTLIVMDAHVSQLHAGLNSTVTLIRQTFWIPSIRQCVKRILRRCVTCRKVIGRPYSAPDPPPLPKIRLQESPPFSVTGVDFTGALYVTNTDGSESKAYICLFTCASTRAVHLEVVPDLREDSFLRAFRRFVSRKSLPRIMISDNASTYLAASETLSRLLQSPSLKQSLSNRGTDWQFIPKRAPWYGGWWERLIGLTKNCLKKVLGRTHISLEMLQTIVTEIEAVINDRPLTYMSTDIGDAEPLTPSHILYGRRITSLPYPPVENDELREPDFGDHTTINKRVKLQALLIQRFWSRWKLEYLTSLREFHRTSGNNNQVIQVGDVVQIHENHSPRVMWKLAVVEELNTGNDGLVRSAKIRTSVGQTNRPIVKLFPLEVTHNSKLVSSVDTLPKRVAAIKAKERIKGWTK